MKNLPDKIYLQVDPDNEVGDFSELEGVTWCRDKVNDTDVAYVRQEWISVEDRLPGNGECVWIYEPDHGFITKRQRCVIVDLNDYLWQEGLVTHWMPLPEAPTA